MKSLQSCNISPVVRRSNVQVGKQDNGALQLPEILSLPKPDAPRHKTSSNLPFICTKQNTPRNILRPSRSWASIASSIFCNRVVCELSEYIDYFKRNHAS